MTEEALEKEAREYATENYEQCVYDDVIGWTNDFEARKASYIAGAKAHLPQWHDLRKNPNDLPEESGRKLCLLRGKICGADFYNVCRYVSEYKEWGNCEVVVAWCEIPKFEE